MSTEDEVFSELTNYIGAYLYYNHEIVCSNFCPQTGFTYVTNYVDITPVSFTINDWTFQNIEQPTIQDLKNITREQLLFFKRLIIIKKDKYAQMVIHLINLSRAENRNILSEDVVNIENCFN